MDEVFLTGTQLLPVFVVCDSPRPPPRLIPRTRKDALKAESSGFTPMLLPILGGKAGYLGCSLTSWWTAWSPSRAGRLTAS